MDIYIYNMCDCNILYHHLDSLCIWTYRYILQYTITYIFLKQLCVFFISPGLSNVYTKILQYDYKQNNL